MNCNGSILLERIVSPMDASLVFNVNFTISAPPFSCVFGKSAKNIVYISLPYKHFFVNKKFQYGRRALCAGRRSAW